MPISPPGSPIPPLDPAIVDRAPVDPEPEALSAVDEAVLMETIGDLSSQVENLKAENDRLKGQQTFDQIRTKMAEPYANRVFVFLIFYCVFVGIIILMNGFPAVGFHISDVVLAVIAGSTAVAAIGLVGFVVSGLFGSKPIRGD